MQKERSHTFILGFDEIGIEDIPLVGGKNASLGEMLRSRKGKGGLEIPPGFAITSYAFRYMLEKAGAVPALKKALQGLDISDGHALVKAGAKAREILMNCELPSELREEIIAAYRKLCKRYKSKDVDVAVRSCWTPANAASPRSSRTGRSPIGWKTISTISKFIYP
jgi:pyruvate,water dikinase